MKSFSFMMVTSLICIPSSFLLAHQPNVSHTKKTFYEFFSGCGCGGVNAGETDNLPPDQESPH